MGRAVVTGLENQGPGQILSMIGRETDVNPDNIGNIEIKDGFALVEAPDPSKLADQLHGSETKDGNVLGSSVVTHETKEYIQYAEKQLELIEMERQEEINQTLEEIKAVSGKEREYRGRALTYMNAKKKGETLGGVKVQFTKDERNESLPDTEISVGDVVMVSKRDPLRDDNPTGTVVEKTNYSLKVVFSETPGGWVFNGSVRVDLYVNDVTFQRMKKAVVEFLAPSNEVQESQRDILAGLKDPKRGDGQKVTQWYNSKLNESQKKAVEMSLDDTLFNLVHGPPGTGKTTTGIEIIQQAVANGEKVLATADSNTAVDNILEKLLDQGLEAVRIGHPARVSDKLKNSTLDAKVQEHEKYRKAENARKKAFEKKDELNDLTAPSGRYRRGMSDRKIKELANQGKGSRGVPAEKIKEMAAWLDKKEEVDKLFDKADRLRQEAVDEIVGSADLVCSTNSTAGSDVLDDFKFDRVVIDECTQATEPSSLIPLTRAEKCVLIGDHRQLPPTVKSREAENRGFDTSLFEKLAEQHEHLVELLKTQYRMNKDIMDFSSKMFYNEELEAAEKVRNWDLEDLGIEGSSENVLEKIASPTPVVQWYDTRRIDAGEHTKKDSTSKMNSEEAEKVTQLVGILVEAGLDPEEVAVVAPYDDQVELLEDEISEGSVEVNTVDGFQGREKEVVILSLTRSNDFGEIGFLKDERRLNVSVTRAKRKLVIVGDSETVSQDKTFDQLLGYVEDRGEVIEL